MRQTAFRDSTEPVSTVSDAPPAYLLQERAVGAPVRTTTEEVDQTPEQTDTRPSREENGSLTCGFAGTEATSYTPHRRGSGRYANSALAGRQRERPGPPVRGASRHGVGESAVTLGKFPCDK